jgi:tripartite-type tricarboxylate transporter receptor subunit TctC
MKKIITGIFLVVISGTIQASNIKIIVPFSAGGVNDHVARQIQNWLITDLKQPVALDYKLGNSGDIGTTIVANEKSNDTVLLLQSSSLILHNLTTHQNYNLKKNLKPVAYLGYTPMTVISSKPIDIKSACSQRKLSIGTAGTSSATGINAKILSSVLNDCITVIPFKGVAETTTAVLGGHVDLGISFPATTESLINNGKLHALGVIADQRVATLPTVATMQELGFNTRWFKAWMVLLSNSSADSVTLARVSQSVEKMLADSTEQQKLNKIGIILEHNKIKSADIIIYEEINKFQNSNLKNLVDK